jgi:hypothetical protein
MAKVEIMPSLEAEINKKFKQQSIEIFQLLKSVETQPKKGRTLGTVGGIVIKELKYEGFRFYFITDAHRVRFMEEKELVDLLLRFVRMSDKKKQQKTIEAIKEVLLTLGPKGFR